MEEEREAEEGEREHEPDRGAGSTGVAWSAGGGCVVGAARADWAAESAPGVFEPFSKEEHEASDQPSCGSAGGFGGGEFGGEGLAPLAGFGGPDADNRAS